ncbi:hypothetical protein CF319_g7330 [Tilletia indica]|uniref:Thioredoxin n=1 Tax=Tilletia indica TaxID=43049 RepID=A0A177TEM1_9BASI|nr:hypothetical protein CF319_g7330 [Tilletia indica]KAE8228538.1 hypothetical protein CF326_g6526 [Tilletia indica]KAE8244640.1 hypothetical protein A4X13_0g6410 [Tilletia indica]
MTVTELKSLADFQRINTGTNKIIVYSKASWCRPCESIGPIYDQLASTYASQLDFYSFDVDEVDDVLSEELGIRSMPTFIYLRNGMTKGHVVGANQDRLEEFLAQAAKDK